MALPGRRDVLKAAVGSIAGGMLGVPVWRSLAAHAQAREGPAALGGELHILDAGGRNIVVFAHADGTVLVDGGAPAQSAALLDEVAALSGGVPVSALFNTCWHPESTGSNLTLARAGATIIAHENTRLWLTQHVVWPYDGRSVAPLADAALPNKRFYDKETLAAGDRQIHYGHVRACPHTDGDCYVFFADANVLAVGDAVSGAGWPSIDWWTGGWIGGVVGALEQLLVLADGETRIVPARGPVLRRADLAAQHELFDAAYERLSRLLHSGIGLDEAVAARPLAEFDAKMGASDEFVRRAFESLWGYIAPDA